MKNRMKRALTILVVLGIRRVSICPGGGIPTAAAWETITAEAAQLWARLCKTDLFTQPT